MVAGVGTGWSGRTLTNRPRRYRISSLSTLGSKVNSKEVLSARLRTPSVLRVTGIFKVVREDDGGASGVVKPWPPLDPQT